MPKMASGKICLTHCIHCFPIFLFLLSDQHLYIVKNMCKQYIHKSDHVETVYELLLLPNNTASEAFLQKSGAVQVLTGDLPMGHQSVVTG
jgi:hypothetical protein